MRRKNLMVKKKKIPKKDPIAGKNLLCAAFMAKRAADTLLRKNICKLGHGDWWYGSMVPAGKHGSMANKGYSDEGHGSMAKKGCSDKKHGSMASKERLDEGHGSMASKGRLDEGHGSMASKEHLDEGHGSMASKGRLDEGHGSMAGKGCFDKKRPAGKYIICRYAFPDFALFAAAIQYAFTARYFRDKGFIPVIDLEPCEEFAKGNIGAIDAWGFAFGQQVTPKDALTKDWVYQDTVNSPHAYLARDCLRLNGSWRDHWIHAVDRDWRAYYQKANQMVKGTWTLKPEILDAWEKQVGEKLSPADTVLGVALREDFAKSADEGRSQKEKDIYKSHPVVPEVDETLRMVERQMEIWNCNKLFVSTERWESMALFKAYFGEGNVLCINRAFMAKQGFAMFYEDGRTVLVEENYYLAAGMDQKFAAYATEVWGLSRCAYLLAAKCSGAIAALTFNGGAYKDICILSDANHIARY